MPPLKSQHNMEKKHELIRMIQDSVLVLDGAMGTSIQSLDLGPDDFGGREGCHEQLNFTRPDAIKLIHRGFLDTGCLGVETNTFGGNRLKLDEYDLGDRTVEVNRRAAEIAREACDFYLDKRYVIGSLGPSGKLPSSSDPNLGDIAFDDLADVYEEQATGLITGGADLLSIETSQDILEVKAAVYGCKRAITRFGRDVPVMTLVTLDPNGRMLLGTDIGSALVTMEAMGIDIFGINCSTGPEEMRDSIRFLSRHAVVPIACLPNMGIPKNVGGRAVFPLGAAEFAEQMAEFVERFGVAVVGGCCGSTPDHIAALVERAGNLSLPEREVVPLQAVSSAMTWVPLEQKPGPLLVGERINAQGSRKMKKLLLEGNTDGIAALARDQAEKGAHVLDVCVALNELEGETARFVDLAGMLARQVAAPIMIDSTDPEVINEAIKNYPGRVIVNSVNLENGEERIDAVGETARNFGACLIALTIDETGMAKTRERKLKVAARIADILARKYAIPASRIIVDPLTFTLATGEEEYRGSAVETLETIADLQTRLPGTRTILGISNLSFGLKKAARLVLNSVFLYHSVKKGLDLAIVNPSDITPYANILEAERSLAEDLIFNRREDALPRLIEFFESSVSTEMVEEIWSFDNPEKEVHHKIVNRYPDDIESLLEKLLETKTAPDIINTVLLPAMKEVGDKFGSGELILPFVLQSAEVMKRAVNYVEQFLTKSTRQSKGRVILATVQGDVHDIGKNLVKTILVNNGYEVKDLGKRVPVRTIVEETRAFQADAVGLSALLVSTSRQMPIVAQEMYRAGLRLPILVGGAAVTGEYARQCARLEDDRIYPAGVFYAKDAFGGLDILNHLMDPATRQAAIEKNKRGSLFAGGGTGPASSGPSPAAPGRPADASISAARPPEPPFWGLKEMPEFDLDDIFACMNLKSLYRLSWGIRRQEPEKYKKLIKEKFEPMRLKLQQEAKDKGFLVPKAVYGYFPCKSDGNEVILFDPDDRERRLASFNFPRQAGKKQLCIADYFRDDDYDLIALQLVTMGPGASTLCRALDKVDAYSNSYHIHGLSVEAAEGLAEYVCRHIQSELGLELNRGKRYSHGYPACPDLADNRTVHRLLEAEERIGVTITEAFQYVPEQSTGALFVHHPAAEYFSVK